MKTKQVNNKTTKEMPIIFNMDGLKKKIQEYLDTLDNSAPDESYATKLEIAGEVLNDFVKYVDPNKNGILSIFSLTMKGNASAVVIAFSEENAKQLCEHEIGEYTDLEFKTITYLGEASKGQEVGVVTMDRGIYV